MRRRAELDSVISCDTPHQYGVSLQCLDEGPWSRVTVELCHHVMFKTFREQYNMFGVNIQS